MDWTAEAIDTLRALWSEGHSTAEIGRRMGISKNAVVGKAHRLNLSARPSPIRREEAAARLAALPQPADAAPVMVEPARPLPAPRALAPAASRPELAVPTRPAPPPLVRSVSRLNTRNCCWPIGEPGTPEFRFCTAAAAGGRPYCAEHAAIAYVKARDRREDAA